MKRRAPALKRWLGAGLLSVALVSAAVFAIDRWTAQADLPPLELETSVTVLDRNGDLLRAYTVSDGRWRLPATVQDVDPRYLSQLIAYEDKRFYRHNGVDLRAMTRALGQAVWHGGIVSGGSTLTMQVARLIEGGGTGRWGPKLRQIRVALALERKLSKTEILNLYLKLAPFGGNLEGVRAASISYFGKEPNRLTAAQSALLIALPQSPETRRPDRASDVAESTRNRVLARLTLAGALPKDEAQAAMTEPVPTARQPFPAIAPHLSDRIARSQPLVQQHRLTIDKPLQETLEKLAKNHVNGLSAGLSAAIFVMDFQSGQVLASVGSAGYLDHEKQGFIDMTRATRSPGSTLKPLIYGLAFDTGRAHPETLIEDRPIAFGTYAPQNFDKQFYGTISLREALQYSLNIPAVALLEQVGPQQLVSRMRRAGVQARLPAGEVPGLAIGLGGVGLSLVDLVTLYGGIANGGIAVAPKYTLPLVRIAALKPLMSPESAWQVSDILTGVKGPNLSLRNNLAYKTGTSYGYRDAWAIGFDGKHVIGVWVGRPDGASVPGMMGAELAAPLLFDAFSRLKPSLDALPPPPPATLIVSNAQLPQQLKRFRGPNAGFEANNPPEIAFPPNGAKVDLGLNSSQATPLVVKVRGGTPPFTWIADGVPMLIATRERQAELPMRGAGFLRLSVIDGAGRSQAAVVEVQ
ncbi:MAG: penicillin-binding protein 1C [Rhodobacterales bacterium]